MSAVVPFAERIEAAARERAAERVDAALAQARDVAFRAYSQALRPACGIPFEVVISDVMTEAEKSLRAQAVARCEQTEMDAVLRQLAARTGS